MKTHTETVDELEQVHAVNADLHTSNTVLTAQCAQKDAELTALTETLAAKDVELRANCEAARSREAELNRGYDEKYASLQASSTSSEQKLSDEIHKLKTHLKSTENLLLEAQTKTNQSEEAEKKAVAELSNLKTLYAEEQKRCAEYEEKSRRRVDKAIAEENERLLLTIEDMEERQRETLAQFEVYKKYAEDVLNKEKLLNSKLRKLRSVDKFSRSDSAPSIGKLTLSS